MKKDISFENLVANVSQIQEITGGRAKNAVNQLLTIRNWVAEHVGTSPSYVNKIVRNKEQIMNKTFLAMMEALGYDIEFHYVKRAE